MVKLEQNKAISKKITDYCMVPEAHIHWLEQKTAQILYPEHEKSPVVYNETPNVFPTL